MPSLPPLVEFQRVELERPLLGTDEAEELWRQYGKVVKVEFPSPLTKNQWRLTSQGWCGYLPLAGGRGLELHPKVPVSSVWRMLDTAYFTKIQLFDGEFNCETLPELIERLAAMLSHRVLERARRGLYRAYLSDEGRLSCVRGRIDTTKVMRAPWTPEPFCRYQRHTGDIEDNRILTWTLGLITRSGICHERNDDYPGGALPVVRQAYRTLSGVTSPQAFTGRDCRGRRYHRLNEDYAVLHALCRFFLDFLTPGHLSTQGEGGTMIPFLIPMERLFEDFVVMWLHHHLDSNWKIKRQEKYDIGANQQRFKIDIVLYDALKKARCVIDTKYKAPGNGRPSSDDIAQVIAYAVVKNCRDAVLLYPTVLSSPLDAMVNGIRVRSMTFSLSEQPDVAGNQFLREMKLEELSPAPLLVLAAS